MAEVNQVKAISLSSTLWYLFSFVVLMGTLFTLLSLYNDHRKDGFIRTYKNEFNTYLEKHREGVERVFTEVFTKYECASYADSSCADGRVKQITAFFPQDPSLKDYSSTVFLKKFEDGKVHAMCLSGSSEIFYSFNNLYDENIEYTDLLKLLDGKNDGMVLNRYLSCNLQEPIVIFPIKKQSGESIGAIGRSIIE